MNTATAKVASRLGAAPKIVMHERRHGHWYEVAGHPNPDDKQGWWPSVTGVLQAGVPKPGLVGWARSSTIAAAREALLEVKHAIWQTRSDYEAWVESILARAKAHKDSEASDYGRAAHALIAAWVKESTEPAQDALGYQSYGAFRGWLEQSGWTIAASELAVFHEGIAGTVDLLLYDGYGTWMLADIKTGAGLHPDMAFQAAAYARAASGYLNIGIQKAAVLHLPRNPRQGEPFAVHQVRDMAAAYMGYAAAAAMQAVMKMDHFNGTTEPTQA